MHIQNHILTMNNIFKMYAGKFMQSYENNLFHHILTMYAGKFMQSYENNLFHHILFWIYSDSSKLPHQTCNFKKFLLTQGKPVSRAMLPQMHWTQGMVRNTWPYQLSISLWLHTSVQNLPALWACWCKLKNGISLTHVVLFILCDKGGSSQ